MFKLQLIPIRPKEQLILDYDPNISVNEGIVQYLLNHQINGIRFLYRNYKKRNSCILNDESGSGKCFQCIAFIDAIRKIAPTKRVLIICQSTQCLTHWQYHIDCFLDYLNLNVKIADNENDTIHQNAQEYDVMIASLDHILTHLSNFTSDRFDCMILQDQHLQISAENFEQLKQIQTERKIILCSNDLIDNLTYFYEVMKFCDQIGPLTQNNSNHILTLDEFKQKFDCNDKSISKRNILLRKKLLQNACSDFYIRRLCNQFGSQFPPITMEDFQVDFDAWKASVADTAPTVSNMMDNDNTLSNGNNQSVSSVANSSLLNTACTDFSDFDTQMSPLRYSDSDNSICNEQIENLQKDNSQQFMTPEIACNQEHAARAKTRIMTRASVKMPSIADFKTQITPIKQSNRMNVERISPASKRLNYKQLPIRINSNATTNLRSKKYLFRTKKKPQNNSTALNTSESECLFKPNSSKHNRSTSSDIQIVSEVEFSPIIISTSEDEKSETQKLEQCSSPDLFTSFTSDKTDVLSQKMVKCSQESENENRRNVNVETDTFREMFGAPDECDDIDLLSNTNVDIFEITKNDVFDNVLCSNNDKITPLKRIQSRLTPNVKSTPSENCLSGLRITLPHLKNRQVSEIENDLKTKSQLSAAIPSDSNNVVDLTLNESQKINEINSDDNSIRNREKTPERKQELTPSTRTCLKRNATTEERRKKSPYSRFGWLSISKTSPTCGTPQSRRRLEKWRKRTNECNLNADGMINILCPRNLLKEFKSKTNTRKASRYDIPSTSTAQSPSLFSDQE